MKTITTLDLLLSALLIVAFCVFASAVAQTRQPVPPAAGPNDYLPDKWDEYISEQGRFSIRFPGKPKDEVSSAGVHFLSYSGLLEYRVSYVDDQDLTEDPNSVKRYLEESRVASMAIAKIANERIIKEETRTIDGHPGYFLYVETAKGWVRNLELVVGQRVYNLIVEGRKSRANEIKGRADFEDVAMRFINSFKLIPSSSKPNNGMQRTRNKQASFH